MSSVIFSVSIDGKIDAKFDLKGGVDTCGIRRASEAAADGDGFNPADALLAGLYLETSPPRNGVVDVDPISP